MKRIGVLGVVVVWGVAMALAAHAQAPTDKGAEGADADVAAVVKLEMETLEWSRRNLTDKMAEHHAEDWIGIPNGPPMTRAEMLADVGTGILHSYKVSNVITRRIAKDVVLVTYRMQQDGTTGAGVKWVPLVQASAVWAKRDGKWLAVFYQETVL